MKTKTEFLQFIQWKLSVKPKSFTDAGSSSTSVHVCVPQIEFVTGTKKGTNPSSTAASTAASTSTTTATGEQPPAHRRVTNPGF